MTRRGENVLGGNGEAGSILTGRRKERPIEDCRTINACLGVQSIQRAELKHLQTFSSFSESRIVTSYVHAQRIKVATTTS